MSDLFDRITEERDPLTQLLAKIPGFKGYIDRQDRRISDKVLRDSIAARYEELWGRVSSLQRDLIGQGQLAYVDDLEESAIKLRQLIDRIRTASYGYAGFFDAIKINQEELNRVYQYDLTLLNTRDDIAHAVDNVESSIGTDGLPAAIRHLTSLAQQAIEVFNRRSEAMIGGVPGSAQ